MLGDAKHCEEAEKIGVEKMTVDDLKKLNKNKKLVNKLAKKHHLFIASESVIKQIPRLLGARPAPPDSHAQQQQQQRPYSAASAAACPAFLCPTPLFPPHLSRPGPGLNKAGKFPALCGPNDPLASKARHPPPPAPPPPMPPPRPRVSAPASQPQASQPAHSTLTQPAPQPAPQPAAAPRWRR